MLSSNTLILFLEFLDSFVRRDWVVNEKLIKLIPHLFKGQIKILFLLLDCSSISFNGVLIRMLLLLLVLGSKIKSVFHSPDLTFCFCMCSYLAHRITCN
jgi:hypothetical protein